MGSIFSGFRRSSKQAAQEPAESTSSSAQVRTLPENSEQSSRNNPGTSRSTSQNHKTDSKQTSTPLTEASTQGSNDQPLSDRSQTMRLSKNNPGKPADDDFDLPSEPVVPSAYSAPNSLSKPLGSHSEPTPSAVIGPKITIKGELTGEEDLMIQGRVEGTIDLKGNHLTIGKQGVVKANVMAKTITIQGTVEGDVIGEERVSITASSNVQGNVIAGRVTLEDGAKFRGSIDMESSKVSSPSVTTAKVSATASAPQQGSNSGGGA